MHGLLLLFYSFCMLQQVFNNTPRFFIFVVNLQTPHKHGFPFPLAELADMRKGEQILPGFNDAFVNEAEWADTEVSG